MFANIFISLLITIGPNVNVVMKFIIDEMNIYYFIFLNEPSNVNKRLVNEMKK